MPASLCACGRPGSQYEVVSATGEAGQGETLALGALDVRVHALIDDGARPEPGETRSAIGAQCAVALDVLAR